MTALTTLPLSTRILITKLAIFVNVEKMEVRIGSSVPCIWVDVVGEPLGAVFSRTARAMVRSMGVNGIVSLTMHPTKPGGPSNPAVGPDQLHRFP